MFIGDLLLFSDFASGPVMRETMAQQLAEAAPARLYVASVLGPIAASLYLVGFVNIYRAMQPVAPRASTAFLALSAQVSFFAAAFHAVFGTLGDALRPLLPGAVDAAALQTLLDGNLSAMGLCYLLCSLAYFGILARSVLRGDLAIPRWFLLINPVSALAATEVGAHLPAPLGGVVVAGGWNLFYMVFFGIAGHYLSRTETRGT